jgi:hypothetical protein
MRHAFIIVLGPLLVAACSPMSQVGIRNYQAWGSNTCCGMTPSPVPTAALGGNAIH